VAIPEQVERTIFEAALALNDARERAAFLDQECKGNLALRQRLEKLLALAAPAAKFFEASPVLFNGGESRAADAMESHSMREESNPSEIVETVIDRYRLLRRLGEGGCGIVFLAEQQEPICRRVALKIIRLGMDTESVIARFQGEREALAMMDHPNIAHVLDAGATESGRPYFVMELVNGAKITDFCDQNSLDTRQRLNLFIQVCHAIQHAHQKGIVHRDIKPSNILVRLDNGVPLPKVIDFGIAKAMQCRLADHPFYTARDQFIGTPAYMSPEQADTSVLDVDTRSDIYSLGVLLYELITGQTPFDSKELTKSGIDEMRRTLRECEPKPPSTALTALGDTTLHAVALQHHIKAPRLITTVKGDLDWIVMKTLEKDRSQRYQTVNALAMDVQRFLDNEPVVARPPSRLYSLKKLVRRNKIAFGAGVLVVLALIAGLGTATWFWHQEHEALKREKRLREESDHLRQQAEWRQNLTEATVAFSRDRIEEADRLIAGIPVPEPNLEYADLYRTLVDWHANNGRWHQAMDRCAVLIHVGQPDDWDRTTLDYLRYGMLLLETGDSDGYEAFKQSALARFANTVSPEQSERILKINLLTPAGAGTLAALAPLVTTLSNDVVSAGAGERASYRNAKLQKVWFCFSLSLMDFRHDNEAGVELWHARSRSFVPEDEYQPSDKVLGVTYQVLLAMAHYQSGKVKAALAELASARLEIESHYHELPQTDSNGTWFDWSLARILLREATALVDAKD
jgi:serine/threonine protein kinase